MTWIVNNPASIGAPTRLSHLQALWDNVDFFKIQHNTDGTHGAITPTTVTPSGLVDISGAAAGRIKFPAAQNADSNANTLDDYEEGSWTPTLTCGTSGTITLTVNKGGKYVKNGSIVTVTGYIPVDSVSSPVGQLRLGGLPFTNGDAFGNAASGKVHGAVFAAGAITQIMARLVWSGTYAILEKFSAGAVSDLAGDVQAGTTLYFSMTYLVTF